MFGLTLVALAGIGASGRVIGWIIAAASLAAFFHPIVEGLARFMPRALALVVVLVVSVSVVGGIAYAVVDDVVAQVGELRHALPDAANQVEQSTRFGQTARDLHLAERAQAFVDQLPARLRGGSVNDALRSAATRGVALLITTVLTMFFLVHGPRLVEGALRQVPDDRRAEVRAGAASAYRRSWTYVSGSLAMSAMAGVIAFVCADALGLPGKAALALWVALFDLIPLIGLVLGAVPIVLLAFTTVGWQESLAVTAVLVGWQLVEALAAATRGRAPIAAHRSLRQPGGGLRRRRALRHRRRLRRAGGRRRGGGGARRGLRPRSPQRLAPGHATAGPVDGRSGRCPVGRVGEPLSTTPIPAPR